MASSKETENLVLDSIAIFAQQEGIEREKKK